MGPQTRATAFSLDVQKPQKSFRTLSCLENSQLAQPVYALVAYWGMLLSVLRVGELGVLLCSIPAKGR